MRGLSEVGVESRLPIWEVAEWIRCQLRRDRRLVLCAPTGSGKTTQVPQMLAGWGLTPGRVVVVEPRRLAARTVAVRVAEEMGVGLGQGVGFTTRYEQQRSDSDQIEFVTDGVFLQRLAKDPLLRGVSAVVLDEFHERRLAVDLALGLVQLLQRRRSDLLLVAMSATVESGRLAGCLGTEALSVEGRMYPVEVRYRSLGGRAVWDGAVEAIRALWGEEREGDILVFMPGAYEIQRTVERLKGERLPGAPVVLALSARSSAEEQDRCFRAESRRRIIVSTNVAETSVTMPYVTAVVDSGLARVSRFDARRGLERLAVESISQASATQRAGRAGRTAPGVCVRLWSPAEERGRAQHDTPEVYRADLTEWVLRLASMGLAPEEVPWLDAPEAHSVEYGWGVLRLLGALSDGGLTEMGRLMATAKVHPRLARALLEVGERELEQVAMWCGVLAEEVPWRWTPEELAAGLKLEAGNDLEVLAAALEREGMEGGPEGVSRWAAAQVHRTAAELVRWRRQMVSLGAVVGGGSAEQAMVAGFPDRVGAVKQAGSDRVNWTNGTAARLHKGSTCRQVGPLLALDLEEREAGKGEEANRERWIRWAMPVSEGVLAALYPKELREELESVYREDRGLVERVRRRYYRDVALSEQVERGGAESGGVLAELIQTGRIHLEAWEEEAEPWLARARCVASWFPERELLTYNEEELRLVLLEYCEGATRLSQLRERSLLHALQNVLAAEEVRFIERMAPMRLELPSGYKMKLRYSMEEPPTGRARIQDLYGVEETPRVAGGRKAVRVEILAPNNRPVQVTEDLAGFWKTLYPEIRKALSRRYPRHVWK